jgi:hypothetical protein|tara:strand:+ start:405 stop:599 length:195 start_codon:yes stop_codon:yes gene_type:complete
MTYEINFNGETITVVREDDYIKLIHGDGFSILYKESYDDNDLQILLDSTDEEKIAEELAKQNEQ